MNQLADLNNYHDLSGLQQLKTTVTKDPENKEALKQAAQHFESIFIGMMLKSMREANAVFEKDNPMHSNTTKFFRDMYDQQLATDMATNGSMGLADVIVDQLSHDNSQYVSASVLRNDADLERQQYALKALSKASSAEVEPSVAPASTVSDQIKQSVDTPFSQLGLDKPENSENSAVNVFISPLLAPEFEESDDFVVTMWDYAKQAAAKIGVNPAVMIAQSALETGWGKHIIKDQKGQSSFNLFNIKAHRDWDGDKTSKSTIEFEQGVAVRKVEPFRMYNNFTEAFDDFVHFLKSNGRYEEALDKAHDSEQFLQNLQEAGYATDPNYAEKILSILKSESFKNVVGKVTGLNQPDIGA
jgi:flagellar protein FlgJ